MASKRSGIMLLSLALLAVLLGAGFYTLFSLRFGKGDIYPRYSSFRADPQGAKILYKSLADQPNVDVGRRLKPLGDADGDNTTVLFLGGSWRLVDQLEDDLLPFIKSGGRAVLAYAPLSPRISRRKVGKDDGAADGAEDSTATNECETCTVDTADDWGFELEQYTRSELEDMEEAFEAVPEPGLGLRPVAWHSSIWFSELGGEWTVLYRYLGNPVVIERGWDGGSVVLVADSYLFSNEAMVADRNSGLLVRLVGSPKQILFDEMHLGVSSQEGVMMLVNRYRMQGVLGAMLMVAGLFIWQRITSFIPRHEEDPDAVGDVGATVGSMAGFTNLLARHVPQKKLMETMVEEWRATFRKNPSMQKRMELLDAEYRKSLAAEKKPHPVEAYNRLVRILNERK